LANGVTTVSHIPHPLWAAGGPFTSYEHLLESYVAASRGIGNGLVIERKLAADHLEYVFAATLPSGPKPARIIAAGTVLRKALRHRLRELGREGEVESWCSFFSKT
jgi:hypothetical protein